MIQHISFDVWLTLIQSNPQFKKRRDALLIEYFEVQKTPEMVSETFRRFDRHFTKINEIVGKNLDSAEMLLIILADLEVNIAAFDTQKIRDFEAHVHTLFRDFSPQIIDNQFPILAEKLVSEGVTLSILSNTGFIKGDNLRQLFERIGIGQFFAFQCYSDEENCSKPAHQFYDIAYKNILKLKAIDKKSVLHIGDNPNADLQGAVSYGFKAHLFDRETTLFDKIFKENGLF